MLRILLLLLLISNTVIAQHITQFAFWKPKPGQEKNFEDGYRQHLEWHKNSGDTWSWYGWFIISGPRYGLFADATADHPWSDFDRPFDFAGDKAHNATHVETYADFQLLQKYVYLPALSIKNGNSLTSKFLRMITIRATDHTAVLKEVDKLKNGNTFLVYQLVDGGEAAVMLLLGYSSYADLGKNEQLLSSLRSIRSVTSVIAETMVYRSDLSRIP